MKKFGKLLAVNSIIFLLLFVILEIVFRLFGFGYGDQPVERDPKLGWVHPKNYSFKMYDTNGEYGGHIVSYDENRNRVSGSISKSKSGKEIWFVGDSFTEANEVDWPASFVGRIENSTDFSVINYGVMGYSPLLYYIQLVKELQSKSPPKIIFIQLYSNDVSDDFGFEKSTEFDKQDRPINCDGGKNNEWVKILRKSYVARVARRTQLTLQHKYAQKEANQKVETMVLENYVEESVDFNKDSRFAKSLLQINALLDSQNIEHYFFAIPSKYSCITGDWHFNSFSSKVKTFAESNDLPHIDLDKAFQDTCGREKLFYNYDIHCNEKGNELIANELIKKLKPYGNF